MKRMIITSSQHKEIIDITPKLEKFIQKNSWKNGFLSIFLTHTTAALTTADLDPGTDLDMLEAFEEMIPKLNFRHPHDPSHVSDHILSSIIGTSLMVPVENSAIILGTWQRVVLVEFYGPRDRKLILQFISNEEK